MKRTVLLQIAVIIVLGFTVYANSLRNAFLWDDDFLIKDNAYIKNPANLPRIFSETIGMGAGRQGPCYRPLQMLTYMLDYSVWRLNVVGYHLTNILLHILAALTIYWLVNLLFARRVLSFLTSILFVVHPVHTETVAYISNRADLLAALGIFMCLCCYIMQSGQRKTATFLLMVLSAAAALLAKENSLIIPVVLLVYRYVFKKKVLMKELISIFFVCLAFILLRSVIVKASLADRFEASTVLQRIPGFFVAVTEYITLLLAPFNLHMEYGFRLFRFADPKAVTGIGIVLILLMYGFKKRFVSKPIFFSTAWFFVTLLPVSNIYPLNAYMAEHWLYVPSLGFFLIAGYGLTVLYGIKRLRLLAVVIIVAVVTGYAALTIRQNKYWKEPVAFYTRTLWYAPKSIRLYNNLGKAYCEMGRYAEAVRAFKTIIALEPRHAWAYTELGRAYSAAGDKHDAIIAYQKAIVLDPAYTDAYYNLGNAYIATGEMDQAVIALKKAIEIDPDSIKATAYYNNLAYIYVARGNVEEARGLYERVLAIDPGHPSARANLKALNTIKERH